MGKPYGLAKEHGSKRNVQKGLVKLVYDLIDMCYLIPSLAVFGGNVKDHHAEYIQPIRTWVLAEYSIPTC